MPTVSIIIPAYNASLLIRRAIESVLNQNGGFETEIIVVDDCSTDDTVAVVESMKEPRLKILRQENNQGPAAARNRGLREAKGEYSAFLDGDDYWETEFLAETIGFMKDHEEAVAVSVMQRHVIIGKEPSVAPQGIDINSPIMLDDFFEFWGKYNHVCTGSVLFKTEVAKKIGGQREDLRICEDLEFWAMLALHGKWGFIPKILFTSDGGVVTRKQGWLEKNVIRWRNAPPFTEWRRRLDSVGGGQTFPHFEEAIGKVARNLCYCHIMSKRDEMAREEVREYGSVFPANRVNSVFKFMAKSGLLWHLWCSFLRYREYHRNI